ncbi:MAG: plasmid pRiA4b ORF-3 family protein [Lentimicrobium sp.]|nr:plasmid pRiA4b ORF-3 family protein [Lentimicrobium sp.]
MHVYRFRLLHEDQEDFLRDFEILSSQTFTDFHNLIKQSVELPGNELASFFVCDRNWRKKREITLLNMQNEIVEEEEDYDERRGPKPFKMPVSEMHKVRIKDIIDDPHQRLLYEYDFLNPKVFFIELTRILEAGNKEQYPYCVKSEGKLTLITPPLPVVDLLDNEENEVDEIALIAEFDDIMNNEDEEDIPIDPSLEQSSEW